MSALTIQGDVATPELFGVLPLVIPKTRDSLSAQIQQNGRIQ